MKRTLLAATLLLITGHALATGFDCAKAASSAETAICSSPLLSGLDDELASVYKAASTAADEASRSQLVVEQRHWIRHVRDVCEDDACMAAAYRARIGLLSRNEGILVNESRCETIDGPTCRSVVTYRDSAYRVDSFNRSMKRNGMTGEIIGCDSLIDLPVGYRNSNHSFGAYCVLRRDSLRQRVKVCDDDMFGHVAIEPVMTGAAEELRTFTYQRCFGG